MIFLNKTQQKKQMDRLIDFKNDIFLSENIELDPKIIPQTQKVPFSHCMSLLALLLLYLIFIVIHGDII